MPPHRSAATHQQHPAAPPGARDTNRHYDSPFPGYQNEFRCGRSHHSFIDMGRLAHLPCNVAQANFLSNAISKFNFAITNSYAPSTNSNYSYAVRHYLRFAASRGISEHAALPARPSCYSFILQME